MDVNEIISAADIFSAKVNENTNWIFINLILKNGIEGWGEATLNKKEKIIYELAKNKLPQLVGLSINELSLKLKAETLSTISYGFSIPAISITVMYLFLVSPFLVTAKTRTK